MSSNMALRERLHLELQSAVLLQGRWAVLGQDPTIGLSMASVGNRLFAAARDRLGC